MSGKTPIHKNPNTIRNAINDYFSYWKNVNEEVSQGAETYCWPINEYEIAEDALYALLCCGEGGYMWKTYIFLEYEYELIEILEKILIGIKDNSSRGGSDEKFIRKEMNKRIYYLNWYKRARRSDMSNKFPTPDSSYKSDNIAELVSKILHLEQYRCWGNG